MQFFLCLVCSHSAPHAAKSASLYAEERVHLIGGIFVCAALMVNEYVVGALELSRQRLCPQTASKISDAPCGIISRSHKNTPLAYCSDLQYGTMMHQNSIAYLSSSPPSRGTYEPIARPTHISSYPCCRRGTCRCTYPRCRSRRFSCFTSSCGLHLL